MNESFKEMCDSIVKSSITPRRISKDSIIKRKITGKDVTVKTAGEELLGQMAEMYLIPPDEKVEVDMQETIESSTEFDYDISNEVEVGVSR